MVTGNIGKILVVDDEVELQNVLVEALASQGYQTAGFSSGEEALVSLREHAFDVLLTDLMMPGMDGITLVREGLRIDPNLICIMMTGQGTIQTAVDAMKVGAFDYVLKPFRLQNVLPVLTRAMNARHMRVENLQLRETVAIYELAQTIAFTLDSQTITSKLADAALQQTDADEVSVLLPVREDSDELCVVAVRGENRQRLLGEIVSAKESISGWVARERQPLILDGPVDDERFRSLWPHPEIRSSISVPMQVANKLVGTININTLNRARPFTLGQMKAVSILAATAAAALESASLYAKVQQAEQNYRSIFENAVEGIFQSTSDRRFITANPSLARILGYQSPDEVLAAFKDKDVGHQLYVDPNAANEVTRILEKTGVIRGFEFEAYRKDGEKMWLSLNMRLVRDERGAKVLREGTIEDITERKRAENEKAGLMAEIEEQRRRLDNIVASVPGVVWEAWGQPENNRINFVSDYAKAMLGYTVEEWLSTPNFWLTIIHPDDQEKAARVAAESFLHDQPNHQEFRWIAKDGHAVWVESTYVPVKENGESVGLRGVTIDISERKRAEQAVRESEERYRDLVENAHDIIYSHDLKGNYTSINKAGEQITGYSREEALRLNFAETIAPEYFATARDMLRKKLAGEDITAYEIEILAKDGRRITVETNTKLVLQDGVPVGVQGIARDITARKMLENQLRQSQKMEAIGQLAGGVAHDFNNLLTAINGYSSLALQRMKDDDPVKGHLEEIQKAGARAANLTRQLLAFGRKQMLQPLALNLNDVVSDLNKMLQRLIGEDVQLIAKYDPALRKIKADPGQIEQVLVNLIVNARDAMPRGGHLTIETANFEVDREYASKHVGVPPGNYVMLAVSDTGMGMDEATKARIFEPFFTTKEKGKGTGLGLSTVYGIIKQSGGNIWVYSEPERGTTFKIYLPQLIAPAEPTEKPTAEAAVPSGSETIMLVEDEDVVRGLARKILEQAGYKVIDASGGGEAIRLCQERDEPIDLLLTDVVMPESSGKEVADRMSELRPETRVLFMSGYTDEAIVHHGVLDSDVQFIQKPFTPMALVRKVREVLDADRTNGGR